MARCPAHEDKVQSLQVTERSDLSSWVHCHAGCPRDDILAALGITFADLFAKEEPPEISATYDYRDMAGKLLYQAVRYNPKSFKQRRPKPDGSGWTWNMAAVKGKLVAYRLNELKGQTHVVVVEGEKDADRLISLGVSATTNIGGAKKWTPAVTESLVQAGIQKVIILPDNDEAGKTHADHVRGMIRAGGITARVVPLDGLPVHGDVSDWLAGSGTIEQIKEWLFASAIETHDEEETPKDALNLDLYNMTDLGAAESLRDRFENKIRYDHQRKQWLTWDGHFWRPDMDDEAFRIANDHVRKLQTDALLLNDYQIRHDYIKWAMAREKRSAVVSMLSQASALNPLAIAGDAWDSDGWQLGVTNGIVNLKDGKLRPGSRDDFITLQSDVNYNPEAKCPRWLQFLEEVFGGDKELIDYIHKAIGYSLTADMREQCFFVAYGSGSNGKSILMNTLESVFGTYGHRVDIKLFAGFGDQSNSFQNADFRGKRIIFAAEPRANSRMNEHVLKHFTGGETLRAEHKYGRSFTVRPVGKIWLGVNHRPRVSDDSFGFWRRVRLIPFEQTFAGTKDDPNLRMKLQQEISGILSWAVRGCLAWQKDGLGVPESVQESTEEYQQGEDPLADFFETRIVIEPEEVTQFSKIYSAYREWASEQGISDREKLSSRAFANLLKTRMFERLVHDNTRCYKGLRILSTRLDGF